MSQPAFRQRGQIEPSLPNKRIPTIIKKSNNERLFRVIIAKSFLVDPDVVEGSGLTIPYLTLVQQILLVILEFIQLEMTATLTETKEE
jgi:hypothetical protein